MRASNLTLAPFKYQPVQHFGSLALWQFSTLAVQHFNANLTLASCILANQMLPNILRTIFQFTSAIFKCHQCHPASITYIESEASNLGYLSFHLPVFLKLENEITTWAKVLIHKNCAASYCQLFKSNFVSGGVSSKARVDCLLEMVGHN